MTLESAIKAINQARKDWLLHEGTEREERFLAEVRRVLLAYGEENKDA